MRYACISVSVSNEAANECRGCFVASEADVKLSIIKPVFKSQDEALTRRSLLPAAHATEMTYQGEIVADCCGRAQL